MNRVFVVGNITSDIYFDRFLIKGEERSFLRLILMAERPNFIRGMRIVLWDEKAELFLPYLQKGSELAVIGRFQSRHFKDKLVHEIEADQLLLLRNIDWERGEATRKKYNLQSPNGTANNTFIVGNVMENIHFDWFQRSPERGGGQYAFLRLMMDGDEYLHGLRISVRGTLAELAYPYLQPGSKIAVDGHIQTRDRDTGKRVVEVTAKHMTFLENINWESGERARLLRIGEDAQVTREEGVIG